MALSYFFPLNQIQPFRVALSPGVAAAPLQNTNTQTVEGEEKAGMHTVAQCLHPLSQIS